MESEEATTAEEQTKATDTETSPEVQDMKLLPQSESDGIRFTRSMAQNTPSMVSTIPIITKDKSSTPYSGSGTICRIICCLHRLLFVFNIRKHTDVHSTSVVLLGHLMLL